MRVCVLSDEEPEDFDPSPFLEEYDWEMFTVKAPVLEFIKAIADRNAFDVYLNICEGYEMDDPDEDEDSAYEWYYETDDSDDSSGEGDWVYEGDQVDDPDEDQSSSYEGIEVVKVLEELNLPFTGANSELFDPTREEMQAAADAHGVGFAKGYRVHSVEQAKRLVKDLRYPVMVKHPKSYGSTGMIKESRCDSLEDVLKQVERVCNLYGAARMEEFIVGKEYNVLVVENPDDESQPFVYPPTELVFPPGEEFWHTVVKWEDVSMFEFRRVTDADLIAKLQDIGVRMFKAMGIVGYGRCDVRMNAQGELFILEINSNPAIMLLPEELGPADYMILYDQDGYRGFFDRIFKSAIIRQKMRAESG